MDMPVLFASFFAHAPIDALSPTFLAGLLAMFVLHATVLLALVWCLERAGALRHPGWAEFAWRLALFGAFASVALRLASMMPVPAPSTVSGSTSTASVLPAPSMPRAVAAASVARPAEAAPVPSTEPAGASPLRFGRTPSIALPVAEEVIVFGLALWLLGAAWAGVRLLCQVRALARLRRQAMRSGSGASRALVAMLEAQATALRVPAPRLQLLSQLDGPMVVPGAILLPRWAEDLPAAQQRAMLAHELAHVQRHDPRWRFLQRLALVPLFFHPLAWRALRRLEALAETQCDRVAAGQDGARALAECLAECLARIAPPRGGGRSVGLALAMAERDGGIVERVRALLERAPDATRPPSRRPRWLIAGGVLLALVALPGVMVVSRPGLLQGLLDPHPLSIVIRKGDETYRILAGMPVAGDTLHARLDGDVVISPDERTVLRVGPGARFEIEQRHAGVAHVLHMTNDADGPKRIYTVDGQPHPFDADAQAWLAEAIPAIYRLSGFDAEGRAGRILAARGVPGLLDEIAKLDADGARAEYLVQLFARAAPDAAQTDRALALLRDIGGDYEKRRALAGPLARPDLSAEQQASLLAIAAGLGSDFDRAEWLVSAVPKLPFEGVTAAGWSQALSGIGSDYDRQRTLQAVIEHGQPRTQAVSLALRAMQGMGGDFERRTVLQAVVQAGVPLVDEDVLAAIDAIGGDYDRSESLLAFIASARPDAARSRAILAHVRGIGGDYERGRVLAGLAAAMPADARLIADYRDVARTLPDYDRGQAEKALDRFAPM